MSKSRRASVRIEPKDHRNIELLAKLSNTTTSEVTRLAIAAGLPIVAANMSAKQAAEQAQ